MNNKLLIGLVGGSTLLILVLGVVLATKAKPPELEQTGDAKEQNVPATRIQSQFRGSLLPADGFPENIVYGMGHKHPVRAVREWVQLMENGPAENDETVTGTKQAAGQFFPEWELFMGQYIMSDGNYRDHGSSLNPSNY